ncbi:microsomal signal peptidase 25 kDa subunit-domain-containing protein [Stachybotrys elegans]|uniref:Signal peptidase complex subunit 2 n=1 Tax=Stachybotrys elegans TaxID=80388 RepID=A0A8K0WV69_9HYPO|nr:microsomal signal peptidase 25 kDa subunit-domain-containing protein [Stachybotrys elegans]
MANASEKISLYNLADLKNTSDDAIPNYLNSIKFKQSHFLTDVRLGLGYTAFLIAAACFGWDYQFGFDNTKLYTAAAVAVYTLINGALSLWVMYVENGIIYSGTAPSGETITISSSHKKFDPVYRLTIKITPPKGEAQVFEIAEPFSSWFDETGMLVAVPFQEILATAVPIIGRQDPKRVKMASKEMLDSNPELLDAVLAANAGTAATSTAAEPVEKKGGKRRKA